MSFALISGQTIINRAGKGVNWTDLSGSTILAEFADFAESEVNLLTRKDWNTDIDTIGANFRKVVRDAVCDRAAMKCVEYDMTGYGITQAQTLLDTLADSFNKKITALNDDKYKEVM